MRRLASREKLSEPQAAALERYWLGRVEAPLSDKLDELRFRRFEARRRSRPFRRHRAVGALGGELGVLGPVVVQHARHGAKTWFATATRSSVATPSVFVGDHDEPSSLPRSADRVLERVLAWLCAPIAVVTPTGDGHATGCVRGVWGVPRQGHVADTRLCGAPRV